MTSINAMRLDFHSGLCVSDEARYWNPEWMIFFTPEKIRSVVRPDISKEQDLYFFLGTTGTSSIGDEIIDRVEKAISARYDRLKKAEGRVPDAFMTTGEVAALAFDVVTDLKRLHVDDYLKGRFGFTTEDLVQGSTRGKDGRSVPIEEKSVIDEAMKYVTFEGMPADVKGIFGNSQVLAGYDPEGGFRIFYQTERMPVSEEVQEIFLAQGSGRDTCDLQYCHFANTRTVRERRGAVDRVEGLVAMMRGLDMAFRLTAGVEGYPKIIYLNMKEEKPEKRLMQISDMRSKLAAEAVAAGREGYLVDEDVHELVEAVIFDGRPFAEVDQELFRRARCGEEKLFKFLRGWPSAATR
jgi:hypothetical protein